MSASLVIQTSFLGDTILTTPLIAQLAHRGPVDVVVTPVAAALLAGNSAVREIVVYDKRAADRGLRGMFRLARHLRARGYDIAFLAQGSWRSAALAFLARVPQRVGFATSHGRLLYTKSVPYRDDMHHAARLLTLSRPNGREPTTDELRPALYPGASERSAVDALLESAGHAVGAPLVALAPGSVWGTKRWPYYPVLAAKLSDLGRVVVIGGAEDRALATDIAGAVPAAIDTTGRLTLLASAELLRRSRVLVTNDSAPMHLASAMHTPTLAVFGPTVPAFGFGPLAPRHDVVGHDALPCRPCDRHGPQRCPLGHHKCMREISPDAIAERVRALVLTSNGNV